ncbi:MAG: VanZ family protein [Burkholderiales bacterium]|nr:VanZ family protein [Burkholderiales bacterium]
MKSLLNRAVARIVDSHRLRCGLIALTIGLVIELFWLGAQPIAVGLFQAPWDKVAHFVTYGGLAMILSLGFGLRRPWWVLGLTLTVALADELFQLRLPGRQPDVLDWLADAAAAASVVLFTTVLMRRIRHRPVPTERR